MQKLKKSLKNNLLILNTKSSCFVLKSISSKDVTYKVKNLTSNTANKIGLGPLLDMSILKFPLCLQSFESSKHLKKNLIGDELNLKKNVYILVKDNNVVFKNKSYELLIKENIHSQQVKIKSFVSRIIYCLTFLKFHLHQKKLIEAKENECLKITS